MTSTAKSNSYVQGSLFEENFLIRTLGSLANTADIALTELVANAWDAGASKVEIFIPTERGAKLVVRDDGTGLSADQFHNRWMKLGYDRLKHQGKKVKFPPNRQGTRLAYGRNGVGRHGLLCFNNEYKVTTKTEGKNSIFVITTQSESQPFVLKSENVKAGNGHGTELEVIVERNLPDPARILDVISARFLHDPQFKVIINGESAPLENHSGLIDTTHVEIEGKKLKLNFVDTQKTARSALYQGIAFWQGRRLVGEPSWILGKEAVIDQRVRFAKRYTVVVETNDLADFILEDWTGFRKDKEMDSVYDAVSDYINKMFRQIAKENIEETREQVKKEFRKSVNDLSPLGKYEVDEAIESIAVNHPTARPEAISLAIEAIINLEKTRNGKELLQKLSQLSEEDICGLNKILDQWSIKDALVVLDEIDRRMTVIEAIRKLSSDKEIDELKVLHPLITEARWLFGPEFDSPEFISNSQLKTAIKELFKVKIGTEAFENHRKRPDIVIVGDSTMSVTGTEEFDNDSGLSTLNKILLIELKRGGFELTRKERNQAQGYVEDLVSCGSIIGSPFVYAFVVGEKFSGKLQPVSSVKNDKEIERGKVRITTFSQLVDTAERRLFRLREKLGERYDDIPGMELYQKVSQGNLWS